jgi:hypothetical protein
MEARLGVTFNQLAVSNRHLGRGYALGGFGHPRSRISENASYRHLLRGFNESLSFWDREITEKGLTLLVNGSVEASHMARLHDIPFRVLAGSRYRNLHYWACNAFYESPAFEEAYRANEGAGGDELELDAPYRSHLLNRARFMKGASAYELIKRGSLEIARYGWWHLRGYEKGRGYYLSENLRYFANIRREWKRLARLARTPLSALEGTRFVYYPLHLEPEVSLQGISPEYLCQLSLITAVSRDLPAGVRLAVKETPAAVGRRPRDFYEQIAEFKNVVWLDTAEFGLRCAEQCDAVVTICGTGGFEAAIMGKPVIAFGQHNIYNFLPHVQTVTDESRLTEHLADALRADFDHDAACLSGQRYLRAVVAGSFDLRDYDFRNVADFDPRSVAEACDRLAESLPTNAPAAVEREVALG